MAQLVANLSYHPTASPPLPLRHARPSLAPLHSAPLRRYQRQAQANSNGRFTCLLWDNTGKQDQARKALDSALSGKKDEFEKWNKEIKKKEEKGGGDNNSGGGGCWFGWFRRFGDDDHFWQQTQQTSLAILCIVIMYLLLSKGDTIFAVIFNPLLYGLRGTRNTFTYVTSFILRKLYPAGVAAFEKKMQEQEEAYNNLPSAKERVVQKWASD